MRLAPPIPPYSFGIQTISQLIKDIPLLLLDYPHKKSLRILSILLISHIGNRKEDMKYTGIELITDFISCRRPPLEMSQPFQPSDLGINRSLPKLVDWKIR